MKKLMILIIAFLGFLQISKAQTEKGDQTLGANLGFTYLNSTSQAPNSYVLTPTSDQTVRSTNFNIGPSYSYFIADKLDIGANLLYSQGNASNNYDEGYTEKIVTRTYQATLFIRKYYMFQNNFGLRSGAFVGYSRGTEKDTYSAASNSQNGNTTNNNYNGGLNLDLVYYPSKKLGLAATLATLAYDHDRSNFIGGHNTTDNVGFNFINSGLTLSAFYVFD